MNLENGGPREKVSFLEPLSRQVRTLNRNLFFEIPTIPGILDIGLQTISPIQLFDYYKIAVFFLLFVIEFSSFATLYLKGVMPNGNLSSAVHGYLHSVIKWL